MFDLKRPSQVRDRRSSLPVIALAVVLGLLIGTAAMSLASHNAVQTTSVAAPIPATSTPSGAQWITDPESHSTARETVVAPSVDDGRGARVVLGPPPPPSEFGDGTFTVWTDVSPGTYQSAQAAVNAPLCTWQRFSGLNGSLDELIASGAPERGRQTVVISPTDQLFHSQACGRWEKVS